MKIYDIINEDGRIVAGVNTTVDVKPGETERQAKKFFGGNGKPKPLGVKGVSPNQAFNLGLVEEAAVAFYENISHTAKRVRDTEKKRNVKIGSDEWFKLWFSLPYLKESVEDVRSFANQLETKYDLQTLFLSDLGERNAIEIASIIVKKENQKSGVGSDVMNEIIRYADKHGKTLVLTPGLYDKKHGTTSQSRLIKFYKRFGFVENKGRNKNYEFRHSMIRYPQNSESALSEAYKMQLERADDMYILHILDTKTNQRTEVRGSKGYESGGYDSDDRLHKLLDVIGKSANISELMNGEVVTINPKHPDATKATAATDVAFNEAFDTDVEWIKGAAPEGASVYAAKVDDAYIEITYKPMNKGVYISFTRGARMSVTGEGSQNKIFGAVINHIKKWVDKNNPQEIYFSAFKPRTGAFGSQNTTRSGLYHKMVQRFASQNGYDYDVEDTGNEDTFILKRQETNTQTTESLDQPYPVRWSIQNDNEWYGHAKEDDFYNQIGIQIRDGYNSGRWTILFRVGSKMDKTGGGDQFKIFATVKAAVQEWWKWASKNAQVDKITFSAEKIVDSSRSKLYHRFAQQFASDIGYEMRVVPGRTSDIFYIEKPGLEETRSFQPQSTPLQALVLEYLTFTSTGIMTIVSDGAKSPEAAEELKKVFQTLNQSNKKLQSVVNDKQKLETNKTAILKNIHDMMNYAIAHLKANMIPQEFDSKKKQINSVLTKYNDIVKTESIKEAVEPNFDFEWEEAERYPEFVKIGKSAWIELAKKGKAVTIKSAKGINNTDAADPNSFKYLDKDKQARALAQLKTGNVEMPIVAVYSDGWKELIGGNTRLTAMLAQDGKATIWVFKVPDEVAELAENFADGKKYGLKGQGNKK